MSLSAELSDRLSDLFIVFAKELYVLAGRSYNLQGLFNLYAEVRLAPIVCACCRSLHQCGGLAQPHRAVTALHMAAWGMGRSLLTLSACLSVCLLACMTFSTVAP